MKAVNRGRLAKQLHEQHGSLTEVGKILGVSVDRVRQLIKSEDRHAMRPSWLKGLDNRLANILIRSGFTNAEQVRAEFDRIENTPDIGPDRRETLRAWLESKGPTSNISR